ncbi:oligopeptide/dipeptide ABC transporter ATP-binding protein [Devosia sp. 919]|uniref:ABC transporter ATP-binding protein n=1 Tax=Devosia sp. 919 TaxID=2726065 RepID=UPI00155772D1|nr:oligopeptide/dipeptide ABC transporter ATP-binding protein [Devosia sp. 919]
MIPVPLLELIDLKVHFPVHRGLVFQRQVGAIKAVDGISLKVQAGSSLGLVGESGCGKSTLGRAVVGLTRQTSGEVIFKGRNVEQSTKVERIRDRRRIQMVFQDPYASLNPRMTIGDIIGEPIRLHCLRQGSAAIQQRVRELLELVELNPAYAGRYPQEFSGGQRQRVGIARALACEPDLIVCDEPVSALDVSIQAQIVRLLKNLQRELGLTYIFIAHGLGVVKHISDDVAVMYLGKIVEKADRRRLFASPNHAYTRSLVSAVPVPDPRVERTRTRIVLNGDLPSPMNPPSGCRFHSRCPVAIDRCRSEEPPLVVRADGHETACWRAHELDRIMPMGAQPVAA